MMRFVFPIFVSFFCFAVNAATTLALSIDAPESVAIGDNVTVKAMTSGFVGDCVDKITIKVERKLLFTWVAIREETQELPVPQCENMLTQSRLIYLMSLLL